MNSFANMPWLKSALVEVDKKIDGIAYAARRHEPLTEIIDFTLSVKGKRLRPMLVLLCAKGGPDYDKNKDALLETAAAIELTHSASLIHDDIVDDAALRRGRPTVQHSYGKDVAVYAGDYLLCSVFKQLMSKGYMEIGEALADCVTQMCDGELIQKSCRFDPDTPEDRYLQSISGKTASLFETACRLGSKLGGAGESEVWLMSEFGRNLGILFQLRDDLLDWIISQEEAGKPVNEDFYEGVYTLPALHTFSHSPCGARLRAAARKLAEAKIDDGALLLEAREIVRQGGGIAYTVSLMKKYERRTLELLAQITQDENAVLLRELTRYVANVNTGDESNVRPAKQENIRPLEAGSIPKTPMIGKSNCFMR